MDIGTAKPDQHTLNQAPHALIDLCDPSESYSAAAFRDDALVEMAKITNSGKVPLLVGGTMLYFRALSGGLAPLPSASPEVRFELERMAQEHGWPGMHAKLAELDPEIATRIHPNDPQRIQRALEVIELTGRKMSDIQREFQEQESGYRIMKIVLCPEPRSVLHRRIEKRFHQMIEQGFLAEIQTLHNRGDLNPKMTSMRCVGYRQGWSYLEDEIGYDEMCQKIIVATRQLAKRQLTWLRQETGSVWYDLCTEKAHKSLFEDVRKFLELQC
jgi:tRNA dimethylallyltransferase